VTLLSPQIDHVALADLLSDGLFIDGDWVESKDQDPNGEVRLIQLADVGDGLFRDRSSRFLTKEKAIELRCTFLEAGDILVSRMPEPLGRACIFPGVGQPAVTVVDVCVVRPNPSRVRPEWLVKAINSPRFRASMQEFVRGTTRQRISRKNLGTLKLDVPLVHEQIDVSHLVDGIEEKRRDAHDHIANGRRALEHFRQAALAVACSGRLTADWREEYPSSTPDVGSASSKRPKHFRDIESYELEEVPENWTWVQVNDLTPAGGLFDGPFGSNLKSSDYTEDGARVIRLENIGHLNFVDEKRTYVSREKYKSLLKHAVYPGDIVFSSFVEENIRVCVLPADLAKETLAKADCFTLRSLDTVDRRYLALQLASPSSYRILAADVHGATRPRVNTTQLRNLPVRLCSLAEQKEIVQRFDRLMAIAEVLTRRIDLANDRVGRTAQAVLAKAFSGDLRDTAGRSHEVGEQS
jgi:type I restriction enzyme S subunit